jgi:hypothetical protein
MLSVSDPDIWWHLRTGQWILSHGQVPTTNPFSSFAMGEPWVAYSWLFEILVYGLYRHFGLSGMLFFTVAMALLITLTVHLLVRQCQLPFVVEVSLVALTLVGLQPLMSPRPWLVSIVFFALQLLILRHAITTGKHSIIWLLPVLYAVWANLHIQFIYGLAVIFLLAGEGLILAILGRELPSEKSQRIPIKSLLLMGATCVLAALVNPYGLHLYRQVLEFILLTDAFRSVQESQPLSFRSLSEWIVVMLAVVASFILGSKRRLLPFPMLLLLLGCFLGFGSRRDVWVTLLATAFIISDCAMIRFHPSAFRWTLGTAAALLVGLAIGVGLIARYRQLSEASLQTVVEQRYPVRAVEFVRRNNYDGPLFNSFDWGGYLIWSLPRIPVSIDGRGNVHRHRVASVLQTWMGYPGWDSDRELMESQIVIAELKRPLTALLRQDARFRLVYEDSTAAVFVRNSPKN